MHTILQIPTRRKPRPNPRADHASGFESIGDILRRLWRTRRQLQRWIGPGFDRNLSLQLDRLLAAEELIRDALTTESAE